MSSERPEIVKEVDEKASSLDRKVKELEEFQTDIDAYIDQLQGMEPTEREAFFDQADSILQHVEDAETVDDLLELEDRVADAIRTPLQQVALQSLDEFLATLNPELRESTREDVRDNLSQRLPQDLEKSAETYQEIIPIVRDLPDEAQNLIAASIEKTPSDLLSPSTDVKPRVEATNQRVSDLRELETVFESVGDWAPTIEFVDTEAYYQDVGGGVQTGVVKNRLDDVNELIIDLSGAPFSVSTVVEAELSEKLANSDLPSIPSQIQVVKGDLSIIHDLYQKTHPYLEDLRTFGTDQGVFEEEIDDLLVEESQLELEQYSTLTAIQDDLRDLDNSLNRFISEVHKRLRAQRAMIEVLDEGVSSDTPKLRLGTGSMLTVVHVQDNLLQALQDCGTHYEWIIDHLQVEDDNIEQGQLLDIWQRLSQGEEIRLTGDVQDAVLSLSKQLSLSVVLSSE